jgi:hypothetical protein
MLSREEIERMIDQKIEPLTEEIAALKADTTILKEQLDLVVTMLRHVLPPE